MRVAQIVCTYPPYYSGMGNSVYELSAALANQGIDVEVLTPQYYRSDEGGGIEEQKKTDEELQDFARRLPASFTFGNAAILPNMNQILAEFDLIHLHYPFFGTAGAVRRFKIRHPRIPLVVTYHMDNRASGLKGLIFSAYAKFWMPRILESADLLIGSTLDYIQSSDASRIYAKHPEKWIELPFGVDTERFIPGDKSSELADALQIDLAKPVILFVGGMDEAHYFKGVPVLLQAIAHLKKNGNEVQAVLIGEGNLKNDFENMAWGMGIRENVRFVGAIDDEDLPEFYRLADLFVLPSTTVGEAFGIVLVEAYASGVPVIASDLPGVRVVAGQAGQVFTVGDSGSLAEKIVEYFAGDVDQAGCCLVARQVAEDVYSWDKIATDLIPQYEVLVKKLRK
ncbi:MAG TPA: glycosyltransferase family 4 protein [Candidatus Magasanikbacteria bacterium]|nr:glycosyltransferase family 4 protein [Candidatus Magasanikbacteria bacterium]